jgi:hypothetical protein
MGMAFLKAIHKFKKDFEVDLTCRKSRGVHFKKTGVIVILGCVILSPYYPFL